MKARVLFIFMLAVCFSINMSANSRETIKFTNFDQNENGSVKEYVFCDKDTKAPISKTVYHYDIDGRMSEKSMYEWSGSKGWVGVQKTMYNYDADNVAKPEVVKWNKKTNDWIK